MTLRVGLESFKKEIVSGDGDEFLDCKFNFWASTHAPSATALGFGK